jgi:diaminopimelate epimerase
MKFVKMEGLGNDFVVTHHVGAKKLAGMLPRIRALCDRRTGIGADGVILLLPSSKADFRMRIFNADGSEAEMCGNGIRCCARYVDEQKLSAKKKLSFETGAGIIATERSGDMVRVNMGAPVLAAAQIPTAQKAGRVIRMPIRALDKMFEITTVSMGNPHAVIFTDSLTDDLVRRYGAALERDPFFPRRVNVEFAAVVSAGEARMRVWERGCGETRACGTGACAVAVAGVLTGRLSACTVIHLAGGDLTVEWDGNETQPVFMTGPARRVFDGDVILGLIA